MGRNRVTLVVAHLIALAIFFLAPIVAFSAQRLPGDSPFPQLRSNGTRVGDAKSLNILGAGAVSCAGTSCSVDVRRGAEYDARTLGIKCDGSNETSAWAAAYTTLSAAGGGTIVVPENVTCKVASDVFMKSNVDVRCGRSSEIKATDDASFTWGMFSALVNSPFQLTSENNSFVGCTFNLNAKKGPAVYQNGTDQRFVRNVVKNGDTSEASAHNLVRFGCTAGTASSICEFSFNRIECANTSGAKDVGVEIAAVTTAGRTAVAQGNQIVSCDSWGIRASSGSVIVRDNAVTVIGSSAVGIETSGTESSIADNRVVASGSSSVGVKITGSESAVTNNKISAAGASGLGIAAAGASTAIMGNYISLDAAVSGSDTTIGIRVDGISNRIIGNTIAGDPGLPDNTTETTLILVAAQHTTISGNFLSGGLYGVMPEVGSDSINTDVIGNRIMGMDDTGVYLITGWAVDDNYISWIATDGCSVRVGQGLTSKKASTSHSRISNNRLHTASLTAGRGICFTELPATTCNSGSKAQESCTNDNLTDCPGATASCATTNADCCNGTNTNASTIAIIGNECLYISAGGPCIDFSSGISATSATISNVTVVGNVCAVSSGGVCVKFPSSNTSKVTNIRLGLNQTNQGTLYENFISSMGSIDSQSTSWMQMYAGSGCGVATSYMGIGGCSTTESTVTLTLPKAITVTKMSCNQPGDGTCTMKWVLRKNSADQTDIQCTATNVATCSDTGSVSFTGGDTVSLKVTDESPSNCGDNLATTCSLEYTQ